MCSLILCFIFLYYLFPYSHINSDNDCFILCFYSYSPRPSNSFLFFNFSVKARMPSNVSLIFFLDPKLFNFIPLAEILDKTWFLSYISYYDFLKSSLIWSLRHINFYEPTDMSPTDRLCRSIASWRLCFSDISPTDPLC